MQCYTSLLVVVVGGFETNIVAVEVVFMCMTVRLSSRALHNMSPLPLMDPFIIDH